MASPQVQILRRFLRNLLGTIVLGAATFVALWLLARTFGLGANSTDYTLLLAGWILLVGYLFDRTLSAALKDWAHLRDRRAGLTGLSIFIDLLVAIGVLLALFAVFRVPISTIFYGSAFTAVVVALAVQTVLNNVFSGIILVLASPFRVGDRVSVVNANYGVIGPSYPHESGFPAYAGRVEESGLMYTTIRLDNGRLTKLPNASVLQSLVINLSHSGPRSVRVRVTFPLSVPLASFEAAVAALAPKLPPTRAGYPPPTSQVADLSSTTWDGVVIVWSEEESEDRLRDLVLRELLLRLPPAPAPAPSTGSAPPPAPAPSPGTAGR